MSQRLELLMQLHTANPGDAFTLFAIAKEHEKLDDKALALDYYQQLRANSPTYIGLYYHLAKLLESLQRPFDALEVYDAGIDLAKQTGNQHALNELLTARLNIADPDE